MLLSLNSTYRQLFIMLNLQSATFRNQGAKIRKNNQRMAKTGILSLLTGRIGLPVGQ